MITGTRTLLLACLIGVLLTASVGPPAQADEDDAIAALLPYLDPATIEAITKIATKADSWRQTFESLADAAEDRDPAEAIEALLELGPLVGELDEDLLEALEIKKAWVDTLARVAKALREVRKAKTELEDIEQQDVEALAIELALDILDEQTGGAVPGRLLELFEAVKDPLKYVQDFLVNGFLDYVSEPQKIGDTGIVARVKEKKPSQSIFDPDNPLQIELTYAGGITVTATGIYFKYRKGASPTVHVSDPLKAEGNLEATVKKYAAGLASELLSESSDIGLRITNVELLESGKDIGGLKCDLAFGLPEPMDEVDVKANGVVFRTDGSVKIPYAEFKTPTVYPILPMYDLYMSQIGGGYNFEKNILRVFATFHGSAGPEGWAVEVVISPGNGELRIDACLLIKSKPIAHGMMSLTSGRLTLDSQIVNVGDVVGPEDRQWTGGIIPRELLGGSQHLTLDGEGIRGDGKMNLLSGLYESEIGFDFRWTGEGEFYATEGAELWGWSSGTFIKLKTTDRLKRIDMELGCSVLGVNLGQLGTLDVELSASASWDRPNPIPAEWVIELDTSAVSARLEMSIKDLDYQDIVDALMEKAGEWLYEIFVAPFVKMWKAIWNQIKAFASYATDSFNHWKGMAKKFNLKQLDPTGWKIDVPDGASIPGLEFEDGNVVAGPISVGKDGVQVDGVISISLPNPFALVAESTASGESSSTIPPADAGSLDRMLGMFDACPALTWSRRFRTSDGKEHIATVTIRVAESSWGFSDPEDGISGELIVVLRGTVQDRVLRPRGGLESVSQGSFVVPALVRVRRGSNDKDVSPELASPACTIEIGDLRKSSKGSFGVVDPQSCARLAMQRLIEGGRSGAYVAGGRYWSERIVNVENGAGEGVSVRRVFRSHVAPFGGEQASGDASGWGWDPRLSRAYIGSKFLWKKTLTDAERGLDWRWWPSDISASQHAEHSLDRGASLVSSSGSKDGGWRSRVGKPPRSGQAVKIWAVTRGGEELDANKDRAVPLVGPDPALGGIYAYYAERQDVYLHRFGPSATSKARLGLLEAVNAERAKQGAAALVRLDSLWDRAQEFAGDQRAALAQVGGRAPWLSIWPLVETRRYGTKFHDGVVNWFWLEGAALADGPKLVEQVLARINAVPTVSGQILQAPFKDVGIGLAVEPGRVLVAFILLEPEPK